MKILEELESKVNLILQSNKQLRSDIEQLKKENEELKSANTKLEGSLLQEHSNIDSITKEKDAIKVAIESLLKNIDQLEELRAQ